MRIKKILCTLGAALFSVTLFSTVSISATDTSNLVEIKAKPEAFYAKFKKIAGASSYTAKYKLSSEINYTNIDSQLVRIYDDYVRVDVLGLKEGKYDFSLTGNDTTYNVTGIKVEADDRSGYAHFNYNSGVGAYNDDGTLKDNADVIYVTDANKNSVTYDGKTGLANILGSKHSNPLCVRFLDSIKTCQFDTITYSSTRKTSALVTEQANSLGGNYSGYTAAQIILNGWNSYSIDLANGITELEGLNSAILYSSKKFDTNWNMLDVKEATNITIEGVGDDVEVYQWGLAFSKCNSIEVKNLTFTDYPEDAIGVQGNSNSNVDNYSNYWIHNCTFNQGKNNWDLSYEKDKGEGDGSTDFKRVKNLTISYCRYNQTHKSNLIGSGNDVLQYNVTLHHNFYNGCQSRLPLVRQANIHIYNNYYKDTTSTGISVRAKASAFIENNFFAGKNPFMLAYKTDKIDPVGTTIKAIGNSFADGISVSNADNEGLALKENGIYVLTTSDVADSSSYSKDLSATRTTKADYTGISEANYANFDTDSSLFYYEDGKSKVTIMNNASDLPTLLPEVSGAGKYKNTSYNFENGTDITNIDLGTQDGTYTINDKSLRAVRFVGKFTYAENISASDIMSINVTLKVYDPSRTLKNTINKTIDDVYQELVVGTTPVCPKETGTRYYYCIINNFTDAAKGYYIEATSTIIVNGKTYVSSEVYIIE